MTTKYSTFQADGTYYNGVYSGAIVGATFQLVANPKVRVKGLISGFTISQQVEQNVVESVGNRLPEEIVPGRYNGTAAVNGFFSAKKGDQFVPSSSTFVNTQWNSVRTLTEGPFKGIPVDSLKVWGVASANVPQGPRGLLTFDMNGPFQERLNGEETARMIGAY